MRHALGHGVPVEGVCLYPVMDYPGWRNQRHCRCGLINVDAAWERRTRDLAMLRQLRQEQALYAQLLAGNDPAENDRAERDAAD